MASNTQTTLILLILLSLLSIFTFTINAKSGEIVVYWGQSVGDGSLTSTCDTGNYHTVVITFIKQFGCRRKPRLGIDGHCGGGRQPCTNLEPKIKHCQQKGIKVLLSLGGDSPDIGYGICSAEDAKEFANYLYKNFLSGGQGPLGSVELDGIDFSMHNSVNHDHLDDLAIELDALRQKNKHFYLSASPKCGIPDRHLDKAIKTGLFNYVFVQFYRLSIEDPACEYSVSTGGNRTIMETWNGWTSFVRPNNTLFMALTTTPHIIRGYIPPETFLNEILPYIKTTSNYGGIVVWDRSLDLNFGYSDKVKADVFQPNELSFVRGVSIEGNENSK